jgi:hypothetical protein
VLGCHGVDGCHSWSGVDGSGRVCFKLACTTVVASVRSPVRSPQTASEGGGRSAAWSSGKRYPSTWPPGAESALLQEVRVLAPALLQLTWLLPRASLWL